MEKLFLNADGLLLALACAGIGPCTLAAHWQSALVANTAVAVDGSQALQLRLALAAEITLNEDLLGLDHLCDAHELIFAELTGPDVRINAGVLENLCRGRAADAEHVRQGSFDTLLVGDFNA